MPSQYDKYAQEWADLHQDHWYNLTDIAEEFSCAPKTVAKVMKRAGLYEPRKKTWRMRADAFESVNSDEAAYWIGFILGDGYLYEKENLFSISQNVCDINLLKSFSDFLGYEGRREWPIYESGTDEYPDGRRLQLRHEPTYDRLAAMGLDLSSNEAQWPTGIPQDYHNAVVRGFFDADGYISTGRRATGGNYAQAGFWKGSRRLLEKVEEVIRGGAGTNQRPVKERFDGKGSCCYIVYPSRGQVKMLRDWMYRDAEMWMDRKRDIFDAIQDG